MNAQGSREWLLERAGKVGSSSVPDIIRKTKNGVSATRERVAGRLIAERLTGQPVETFKSADMEWGTATEAEAADAYAFAVGVTAAETGWHPHPAIDMAGASPDRLIGDDGLVEIKCPATHTHIATLLSEKVPPDYVTQMQWQMAVTGRQWCDFVSYDPRMPVDMQLFVRRVMRDTDTIAGLESAVIEFLAEIDETVAKLRAKYELSEAA